MVDSSTAVHAPPGGRSPDDWTVLWTREIRRAETRPVFFRAGYDLSVTGEGTAVTCAARVMKCLVWGRKLETDGRTLTYWLVDVRFRRRRLVLAFRCPRRTTWQFDWSNALAALAPDGLQMAYVNPVRPRTILFKDLP